MQHYLANGSVFHVTNVLPTVIASDVDPHRPLNPEEDGVRNASTQTPPIQTNLSLAKFRKEWKRMYREGDIVRLPVYRVVDQGRYEDTTRDAVPGMRMWLTLDGRTQDQPQAAEGLLILIHKIKCK